MKPEVHFSSKTDNWETPINLFKILNKEFNFTLDPCSSKHNAKCKKFFTIEDDGLSKSWANETVFMNPPYGSGISGWMLKAHLSAKESNATCVCLVPSRTDTIWWHDYAMGNEIRFIKGRIKFGGHENSAPFPSALIIMQSGLPLNYLVSSFIIK